MKKAKNENVRYIIVNEKGRYLGNSVWTFDIDRAIHYATKADAERSKFCINTPVKIVTTTM